MFKDSQGNIWVCDTGNHRIISLEEEVTNIRSEISMKDIVPDRYGQWSPISGTVLDGRFYLVLKKYDFHYDNKLITFRPERPNESFQSIDLKEKLNIIGISAHKNYLLLCTTKPSMILKYELKSRATTTLYHSALPNPFINVAAMKTCVYMNQWKFLSKITTQGKHLYTIDMSLLTGKADNTIVNITIGALTDYTSSLLATDCSNRCIHNFSIGGCKDNTSG